MCKSLCSVSLFADEEQIQTLEREGERRRKKGFEEECRAFPTRRNCLCECNSNAHSTSHCRHICEANQVSAVVALNVPGEW